MDLKKLNIKNFLGIGEAKIRFDNAGVVLVEGVNHDSPSSLSNGAGKSSLFEALFWVLFGKTKRGLLGDDVINVSARKNCRVELEFDHYRVVRSRRDDLLGTSLHLFQRDDEGPAEKELTKGSVKETQILLEEIIKLSELTFSKIAYFGQGDIKGFAGLTDAELKRVFEQAMGLTFFGEYQQKVKAYKVAQEERIGRKKADRELAARERVFLAEKIALLEQSLSEREGRIAEELLRLRNERSMLCAELAESEAQYRLQLAELSGQIAHLEQREPERKRLYGIRSSLEREADTVLRHLIGKQTQNSAILCDVDTLAKELEHLESRIGAPCGECGKLYSEHDLTAARESLEAGLTARKEAHALGFAEEKELAASLDCLRAKLSETESGLAAYGATEIMLADIHTRREYLERSHSDQVRNTERRIREIEAAIREISEGAPLRLAALREELQSQKLQASGLHAQMGALEKEIEELQDEMETIKSLEDILGNGGLKSYVFDTVTPQLNRLIDKNIRTLDDIDIQVNTVTKLKNGDYRERFTILVNNHHGSSVFEGNSGGEIQKINLAISLAINTLIRTVSEGSINAIFLDECFENLDEGSSERVLDLIQQIQTPNVFLITHRTGLKDLVTNVLVVEKRGGMATVH